MPPSSMSPHMKGVLLTFLGGLALSFDIPLVRLADGNVWAILATRSICTLLVVLAAWIILRRIYGKAPVLVPGWPGVIVAVFYALGTVFFMLSVFNTTSANVAFILAFNPMFGALLSWIFLRERPRTATFVAMGAMTIGVLIIVGSGLESGHLFGDLMAAMSAFVTACALTYSRAAGRDFGFAPLVAAFIPASIGILAAAGTGFYIADPFWIIFNGLFVTPFAFWALALGPRYLSAAETGMFYLLETVLAPVWVWLVFSENPSTATLVGGAIILIALVWHSTHTMRRDKIPLH
ncbi:DMT family transporter [Rhizobium sp. KVB221]|uniref:DMT family transporter n=1 Tax=Rhizobium setariae TaxID=2801340 RepID=A0A937CNK8_9HYPH|nr:DMT family transporter [Rhizobium setariae]MBL0371303.1 DMT family transporter [Rhizobium setariae]